MGGERPEEAEAFLLAFGGEAAPDAPARIRDLRPRRLRQRG